MYGLFCEPNPPKGIRSSENTCLAVLFVHTWLCQLPFLIPLQLCFCLNRFRNNEKIVLGFSLQSLRLHMLITKAGLTKTLVLNENSSNRILNKKRFISQRPFFAFNFLVILVTHRYSLKFISVKKLKDPSS